MDLVTLGMLIIGRYCSLSYYYVTYVVTTDLDEIYFQHGRDDPALDVLGGAGSWAVFGARMFRPPPESARVGWTVHKGSDFPAKVEDEITSWQTACNFIDTPNRLTTRGWNRYGDDEERGNRVKYRGQVRCQQPLR